ncbi:leucine-rich repeat extensin-like protein 3 [Drosophila ficusphila]|uniref:leucine-rich repeat extensin-like protein 3 n=1 Tax=Drosophila ficusphila TaxID=30025 RepID=UPI0007E71B6E|nr:leucine-rich repeat extensin-like protein 3 [Drosophila ficusphila]
MCGAFRLLLLLMCVLFGQAKNQSDHAKLKRLTSDLVNAIAEANSGKKYGTEWVSGLGQALEEVQRTSSQRCFMLGILIKKVTKLCPAPPSYLPDCYPSCYSPSKPPPPPPPPPPATPPPPTGSGIIAPPHPSYDLQYPDGSYFPWCYMPFCPTICTAPFCYPCVAPHCDPSCVPPSCYPPCNPPHCEHAPTCWHPYCPKDCKAPKCVPGNEVATQSCVPPYCPPPINCQKPYCPRIYRPVARTLMGHCPMHDIANRAFVYG